MAYRVVNEESLTAVADAIRRRTHTAVDLLFPDGFSAAIDGVPDDLSSMLMGTLTTYTGESVTRVHEWTGSGLTALQTLSLPNCTRVGYYGLNGCVALRSLSLPVCTLLEEGSLNSCCSLPKLDVPALTHINRNAFQNCSALTALILRTPSPVTLANTNAFSGTPIGSGTGYIYVPGAMLAAYQTATNWSALAAQLRAIEDYPDITGG